MATLTSKGANPLLVNVLVGFGVLVSLWMIGVSAVLNYRMGFHSGEGGIDGVIYGVGAAGGDLLKSISPFMGYWGRKSKDWLAVLVAVTMYAALTAYSFTAAYGFSAIHRSGLTAASDKRRDDHAGAKAALARIVARLDQLGPQRSSGEVKASIAAGYAEPVGKRTLGEATRQCSVVRAWSRKACAAVKGFERELEAALEQERLTVSAERLRAELKAQAAAPEESDPQREGIQAILRLVHIQASMDSIGYALGVLLAILIEFGSGLGLYLVTTPLRGAEERQPIGIELRNAPSAPEVEALRGEVVDYVSANVMLMEGGQAAMEVLFADYVGWCRRLNRYAVARASFERAFQRFAQLAGLRSADVEGGLVFAGIAVMGE